MNTVDLKTEISKILNQKFSPSYLSIIDESVFHKEHLAMIGNQNTETHFFIEMHSKVFNGVTTIEKHKMVMECLNFAFEKGLHAVRLKLKSDNAA